MTTNPTAPALPEDVKRAIDDFGSAKWDVGDRCSNATSAPSAESSSATIKAVHIADDARAALVQKIIEYGDRRADRCRATVGFFASVIKSGEPWTEHCEKALREALGEQ